MRVIPFTDGAIVMSGDEKRRLASEIMTMAKVNASLSLNLRNAIATIDTVVPLSEALGLACNEMVEILKPMADEDPALAARLDQIHAALNTAYEKVA